MIHVLATIQVRPSRRAAFLEEFRQVVPHVRAETGCIEYGPAIDVDTGLPVQPAVRGDTVMVIEKWQSLAALHAHLAAPHMQTYRERVKDLVDWVEIRILEPA